MIHHFYHNYLCISLYSSVCNLNSLCGTKIFFPRRWLEGNTQVNNFSFFLRLPQQLWKRKFELLCWFSTASFYCGRSCYSVREITTHTHIYNIYICNYYYLYRCKSKKLELAGASPQYRMPCPSLCWSHLLISIWYSQ